MLGDDAGPVAGIAGQFEDFIFEILEDGGQIDESSGTDLLSIVTLPEQMVSMTDWELQTSLGQLGLGLS